MKIQTILFILLAVSGPVLTHAQQPAYQNPKLPVRQRVTDLLSRMTLEEKVAQLRSLWGSRPNKMAELLNNPAQMDSLFHNGIGMMNPDFDATMEQTISRRNRLQEYLRRHTRLGIPTIFVDEAHHGLLAPGADAFPTSIALACSWDTALVRSIYTLVAREASSRGTRLVLAPVVDVCRDPRWGRTSETYGEDPFLCGMMGSAAVEGFQGSDDGRIAPGHVAATLKHFTGHGEPIAGVNQGPANYSERVLREFHMEPFRLCIQNAHPACIMPAYVEIDGIPCTANKWLLTKVLRREWKFPGLVVSDWWGIDQLWQKHDIAANDEEAAKKAFDAGVTMDLPTGNNYPHLVALAKTHQISGAQLDSCVAKVLTLKFELGLFEEKDINLEKAKDLVAHPPGRTLARKAAAASMVLLKNDNHLLPIRPGQYQTIAVIGPCAAVNYLGDYSGLPTENLSILEGIRNKIGEYASGGPADAKARATASSQDGQPAEKEGSAVTTRIVYAKGCEITANGDSVSYRNYQEIGKAVFPTAAENEKLLKEAVETAAKADLVIVAVGENEQLVREAWASDHPGDRSTLELQPNEEALVEAMVATGKPVIVYLAHGRPLAINWIAAHVPAIVDGWFAGEETGNAFADILFGETNPSGKLTISIPRSAGQLPIYYNHKPSEHYFDYVAQKNTPLFPFGYGLSYTRFQYAHLRLSKNTIPANGSVRVSVDLTNTGPVAGDEIVQLYIHQKVASVTRPVKALKGFARVHLDPGETKTVTIPLNASQLAIWTADMEYKVEPGTFDILVGPNSEEVEKVELKVAASPGPYQ